MIRYAWLVLLFSPIIWPATAWAGWRWVVERDRFDDSKPPQCAAIQDFANGQVVALPPKALAEPPSLLVVLNSVPSFELAAANAHAVNIEGCDSRGSANSRLECLKVYSGTLRSANLLMRVGKGPVRTDKFFRYEAGKGATLIMQDEMLRELTPTGILMIRSTFRNYKTYDDQPADPQYVAELNIPFIDIPNGLAMIKRPCR